MARSRKPESKPNPRPRGAQPPAAAWIAGGHAVRAALANPAREIRRLVGRPGALARLESAIAARPGLVVETMESEALAALTGVERADAAVEAAPLARASFAELLDDLDASPEAPRLVLLLDQIEDPRNFGAILRSALGFGADWVVTLDRRSAPSSAAAASAAAGALDRQKLAETGNLARAMERLRERGFWLIGLDARAERTIDALPSFEKAALVLGAEGSGLRRLTALRCDVLTTIPIAPALESLNASVAAGIALHALARRRSAP